MPLDVAPYLARSGSVDAKINFMLKLTVYSHI